MNKKLIERIALEVAGTIAAPFVSDECLTRFARELLARIDAERGKEAVGTLCISHFMNDPGMENMEFQPSKNLAPGQYQLFLSPTIPEGTALVRIYDIMDILDSIENCDFASAKYLANELLAAAQGERNAD